MTDLGYRINANALILLISAHWDEFVSLCGSEEAAEEVEAELANM